MSRIVFVLNICCQFFFSISICRKIIYIKVSNMDPVSVRMRQARWQNGQLLKCSRIDRYIIHVLEFFLLFSLFFYYNFQLMTLTLSSKYRMGLGTNKAHFCNLNDVNLVIISFRIVKNQSCHMMPKYFAEHSQEMANILLRPVKVSKNKKKRRRMKKNFFHKYFVYTFNEQKSAK